MQLNNWSHGVCFDPKCVTDNRNNRRIKPLPPLGVLKPYLLMQGKSLMLQKLNVQILTCVGDISHVSLTLLSMIVCSFLPNGACSDTPIICDASRAFSGRPMGPIPSRLRHGLGASGNEPEYANAPVNANPFKNASSRSTYANSL